MAHTQNNPRREPRRERGASWPVRPATSLRGHFRLLRLPAVSAWFPAAVLVLATAASGSTVAEQNDGPAGGTAQDRRVGSDREPAEAPEPSGADPVSIAEQARDHPDSMLGLTIVDDQDREIGSVESVVVEKANCRFHLVFSSDEFLGMGGDDILVPVEAIAKQGDKLLLSSMTAVMPYLSMDYLLVREDD